MRTVRALLLTITTALFTLTAYAQQFNGLDMSLGSLSRLSSAKTRSISAENFTGEKGKGGMATEGLGANAARELGQGWKVSPAIWVKSGETVELAAITGPGAIQHLWVTPQNPWRSLIIRMYWDGEKEPSVQCPIGDFFACGWGRFAQVSSLPVAVNPGSGLNCWWMMPFRKSCRITVENIAGPGEVNEDRLLLFYQIDYTLTDVPDDAAYFHAQFRRVNPIPYGGVYTLLDGVKGHGQYVGTYMCWGVNNNGWWGEGEIKFFLDGDTTYPTICGTGTEDYFLGSYCFKVDDVYIPYTTPYAGMPQVIRPDGEYSANTRFGLYRWHIMDPVRFEKDLRVTMQALGWRNGGRYLPLQDDIASTVYWYQTEPHASFPALPDRNTLEIQ